MKRRAFSAGAAALALAGAVASGSAFAVDPVKVGVVLPFSGGNSLSGGEVLAGLTLALEEHNATAGPSDARIEIVREDDAGVPTTGVSAVQKLIERDKVVAVIGSQTSNVSLPAGDVARRAKIPMLSGGATSTGLTDANAPGDPWYFRHFPGSGQQGPESAEDAVKRLNCKRLAILYENTSYGRSLAETFSKAATGAGGTIVMQEHYEQGEQDFYTVLTRIRGTNPEGVYLAGLIAEGAAILRQAAEIRFKTQFVGSGGMVTDSLLELAGPASEGFAVSVMYEPSTNSPVGRDFGDRFTKRFKLPGNTLSGVGYDAGRIMFDAIRRAKATDGLAIRNALMTSNVELAMGPPGTRVKFDPKGASAFKLGLAVVKNGKRELLPYE